MINHSKTNWRRIKFKEFADTSPSVKLERGKEYPFIPMDVVDGQRKFPVEIKSKKFSGGGAKFANGDTIFARITPCLENGKIVKIQGLKEGVGFGSTEFFIFRGKDGVSDSDFVYYLSRTDTIRDPAVKSMVGASGRQRADKEVIDNVQVLAPTLPQQKQIADVLSAYDDLIENNTKRIKILEEIAQAIYREWFVYYRSHGHEKVKLIDSKTEFGKIPEGWKVKKLGDNINILRGKNITKDTVAPGKVPVVAGGIGPAYFHNKANVDGPAITVSASGANSGYINLYQEDIWASDCSYINKASTPFIFYYFLLLKSRQAEVTGLQRGSAQPHVYPKDLARLLVVDPPEELVRVFEEKAKSIFGMLKNLQLKNQNLRQARDLLLPKLVTGEIRIN
ncbi:MAG: restriction endonuclease subunit S [Minisyncoccia bacterium]